MDIAVATGRTDYTDDTGRTTTSVAEIGGPWGGRRSSAVKVRSVVVRESKAQRAKRSERVPRGIAAAQLLRIFRLCIVEVSRVAQLRVLFGWLCVESIQLWNQLVLRFTARYW